MTRKQLEAFFDDFTGPSWIVIEVLDRLLKTRSVKEVNQMVQHFAKHREFLAERYWSRKQAGLNSDGTSDREPPPVKSGFIYLCRNARTGLTKIGFSTQPKVREGTLQSEEPDISMIFVAPGTMKKERHLHGVFSTQRVRGEWFDLSELDYVLIKSSFSSKEAA